MVYKLKVIALTEFNQNLILFSTKNKSLYLTDLHNNKKNVRQQKEIQEGARF